MRFLYNCPRWSLGRTNLAPSMMQDSVYSRWPPLLVRGTVLSGTQSQAESICRLWWQELSAEISQNLPEGRLGKHLRCETMGSSNLQARKGWYLKQTARLEGLQRSWHVVRVLCLALCGGEERPPSMSPCACDTPVSGAREMPTLHLPSRGETPSTVAHRPASGGLGS